MVRNGAGVKGSWSWTESNFHPDDKLDDSYTDSNFVPDYSLNGFSQADIYAGKMNISFYLKMEVYCDCHFGRLGYFQQDFYC